MKVFEAIVLSLFVLFVLAALLLMGFKKEEQVSCYKWQEQAGQYSGFYLLQWQKDQCDAHGIEINAPVQTLESNNQ